jgi:hypothetical protein
VNLTHNCLWAAGAHCDAALAPHRVRQPSRFDILPTSPECRCADEIRRREFISLVSGDGGETTCRNSKPLSMILGSSEVLLQLLTTPRIGRTPPQSFLFAVSKTDARWLKLSLSPSELSQRAMALRYGLDHTIWETGKAAENCEKALMPRTAWYGPALLPHPAVDTRKRFIGGLAFVAGNEDDAIELATEIYNTTALGNVGIDVRIARDKQEMLASAREFEAGRSKTLKVYAAPWPEPPWRG